jgi:hypothetical protein
MAPKKRPASFQLSTLAMKHKKPAGATMSESDNEEQNDEPNEESEDGSKGPDTKSKKNGKNKDADTEQKNNKGLQALAGLKPNEPMGRNAAQAVMDRLKSLKKQDGSHQGLEIYKQLKTNNEKRMFGLRLHVDREGSFCKAIETSGFQATREKTIIAGKVAIWEVAKLEGLVFNARDDVIMQILLDLVEGCDAEPHPKPSLAAQGWQVYDYEKKLMEKRTGKRYHGAQSTITKDLDDAETLDENLADAHASFDSAISKFEAGASSASGAVHSAEASNKVIKDKDATMLQREAKARALIEKRQAKVAGMSAKERKEYEAEESKKLFLKRASNALANASRCENDADKASIKLAKLMSEGKLEYVNKKLEQSLQQAQKDMTKHRVAMNKVIADVDVLDPQKFQEVKMSYGKKVDLCEAVTQLFDKPGEGLYAKFKKALK